MKSAFHEKCGVCEACKKVGEFFDTLKRHTAWCAVNLFYQNFPLLPPCKVPEDEKWVLLPPESLSFGLSLRERVI